jgi:hypothetical protein
VIVDPSGNYGCIVDVIARKASNQQVSDTDHRNLVEFWKQIYGIDISPDEIPLLKVKMRISKGLPRSKNSSNDRAPTIEEIQLVMVVFSINMIEGKALKLRHPLLL